MIARLFASILAFLPAATFAEIVPVQIGEQGDATRLVLTIPAGDSWGFSQENKQLRVKVATATGFDTAMANVGFAESRVSSLAAGATSDSLVVALDCDCIANGYLLNDQFLTIDISNRTDAPTSLTMADTLASLARPWHQPLVPAPPPSPVREEVQSTGSDENLDTAISAGLAQATYQGFLELRTTDTPVLNLEASSDILESIAVGVESRLQTLTPGATVALDADAFDCTDVSKKFDGAWNFDLSFSLLQGSLRNRIVTGDDLTDPQAMLEYAMLLVGHGIGHEAINMLQDLEDPSDLAATLMYIAKVIDHTTPPSLIGLETCPESLAFWSFLQSANNQEENLDPRKLMMAFKLLPPMLQSRVMPLFGDALARAGYRDFQAELQDFSNTAFAAIHTGPDTPLPVIDFSKPAAARDILRADLRESDLDPNFETPLSPTSLPLSVLDTMRIERRDTPAEAALLDEVLSRQVTDRNYFAVVQLLVDSETSIDPETLLALSDTHLAQSITEMTEPEILAFAYRGDLPIMSEELKANVRVRLDSMKVRTPPAFAAATQADAVTSPRQNTSQEMDIATPSLPLLVRAPQDAIPTFAESEQLLEGSAAMRNAIETIINDTN